MLLLEDLVAQKHLAPEEFEHVRAVNGAHIHYTKIKSAEAEAIIQQARRKIIGSGYSPVIIQDQEMLDRLAGRICWFPSTFDVSVDDLAADMARYEKLAPDKLMQKAEVTKVLWKIADCGLSKEATSNELLAAVERCELDKWFEWKEKLHTPLEQESWGARPEIGRHLRILGPQPEDLKRIDEMVGTGTKAVSIVSFTGQDGMVTTTETCIDIDQMQETDSQDDSPFSPPKTLLLCLVPVQYSWQIPTFFCFGGYNQSPPPIVQGAFHKYLHDKFGADIAVISTRDIEVMLENPPHASQLEILSHKLCLYNQVVAGNDSDKFQDFLSKSRVWSFWW
jgi:hypothetical protein